MVDRQKRRLQRSTANAARASHQRRNMLGRPDLRSLHQPVGTAAVHGTGVAKPLPELLLSSREDGGGVHPHAKT